MNKVYACIDGLSNSAGVIDWAVWSALRLNASLELLHVLERHPERAALTDFTGAIGLGSQESLLQELSELDERRGKLAQDAGRSLLDAGRQRAVAAGVHEVDSRMRHDRLVDSVVELQAEARIFVMGRHHGGAGAAVPHLDHHVEGVVRSVKRPVLVTTEAPFDPPKRFMIALDGSDAARKTVATVAQSPMLAGLSVLLAMAGDECTTTRDRLAEAGQVLAAAGFDVEISLQSGEPEVIVPAMARSYDASLIVMGAYGHSRIRQLIVGSTTTALLRMSHVPVLILR